MLPEQPRDCRVPAHHSKLQRGELASGDEQRVGAGVEQAAHLPRVKGTEVTGFHALPAPRDALPLGC